MSTYTINLYVHGVPSGQDAWGLRDSNGSESQYIRSFYGQSLGSNDKSQMYVDIRQYDGRTSSYYTYKQDKTIDNTNNRPGGYCAITLRIDNYYYADIQNMFNLLKAAFDKYLVGSILERKADGYRFIVSKIEQRQDILRTLEGEIQNYLMNFSSNSDFIPLPLSSGVPNTTQGQARIINFIDATPTLVKSYIAAQSRIIVSMSCATSKELQINAQVDSRINAVKKQAQQDIEAAQKQARKEIEAHKKKEEEALNGAKGLRIQLDNCKRELNKTDDMLAKIKDVILKVPNTQSPDNGHTPNKAFKRLYLLSCLMLILSAVALCLVIFYSTGRNDQAPKVEDTEAISFESDDNAESSNTNEARAKDGEELLKKEDSLKAEYLNAKIDISYISNQKPMRYSVNDYYPVHLMGVGSEQKRGQWQSSDFEIDEDRIKPKHDGKCTISYVVDDITVVSRELNVAK